MNSCTIDHSFHISQGSAAMGFIGKIRRNSFFCRSSLIATVKKKKNKNRFTFTMVIINKCKCTIDQELANFAAACSHVAYASCSLTRWRHFSEWNDVMAASFKVWRNIRNETSSIDAHLLWKHSCQIWLDPDPI